MDQTTALGLLAGTMTTLAYLPQLVRVWRSKSAEDISWAMLIILCTGIVMWLVYGTYVHDVPLIAANMLTLVFTSIILALKVRYRRYRTAK